MTEVVSTAAADSPTTSDTLHDIHFGSSFLPASAGNANPSRDALFSLKYAQKPASLDATASGKLWADARSSSTVYAAFPSTSSSTATAGSKATEHRFSGKVEPAKEVDCVLIWDEELQSFSLERIDSTVRLNVDREGHGGPTPSLSTTLPAPRPPNPSPLPSPAPSPQPKSTRDPDVASSDSDGSEDSEIRVPSVPPAHLRKLASERARQNLMRKATAASAGDSATSGSGTEEEAARGRTQAVVGGVGQSVKKQDTEVEDFGNISFGGAPSAPEPTAPAPPPLSVTATAVPKATPLSLPPSRSSTPAGRSALPKPAPPPAPVTTISPPALVLPTKASPPRPTPQLPQPAPPPASAPVIATPAAAPPPILQPPARSSPASKAPVAAKRPPSRASKAPRKSTPASTSTGATSPKKGRRRSSVAATGQPLSKETISSSEGSSDGDSDESSGSGSGSGSEEEDTGIPEGYLARPGSILSSSAAGGAPSRPAARKAPMKAPPPAVIAAAQAGSDSDSGSGSGSGSDDDESDDMEFLASSINANLAGPAVGPGRVQGQVGKGKGGAKRASKIPATAAAQGRAGYASKVPASMRSSIASKVPASSSAGATALKGPAKSTPVHVDAVRQREREADVPDSDSEDD